MEENNDIVLCKMVVWIASLQEGKQICILSNEITGLKDGRPRDIYVHILPYILEKVTKTFKIPQEHPEKPY